MVNFVTGANGLVSRSRNQRTVKPTGMPRTPGNAKAKAVTKEEFAATAAPFLGHTVASTEASVMGAPDDVVKDLMFNRPKGASLLGSRDRNTKGLSRTPAQRRRYGSILGASTGGSLY